MYKLLVILIAIMPYIDDVYYWVDKHDRVPVDYTASQSVRTDSIAQPIPKDQIEIIHAQDTTVTVVVHRH